MGSISNSDDGARRASSTPESVVVIGLAEQELAQKLPDLGKPFLLPTIFTCLFAALSMGLSAKLIANLPGVQIVNVGLATISLFSFLQAAWNCQKELDKTQHDLFIVKDEIYSTGVATVEEQDMAALLAIEELLFLPPTRKESTIVSRIDRLSAGLDDHYADYSPEETTDSLISNLTGGLIPVMILLWPCIIALYFRTSESMKPILLTSVSVFLLGCSFTIIALLKSRLCKLSDLYMLAARTPSLNFVLKSQRKKRK